MTICIQGQFHRPTKWTTDNQWQYVSKDNFRDQLNEQPQSMTILTNLFLFV